MIGIAAPFNFIWVPISNKGLVVKVDTDTGAIAGTYHTSPSSHGLGDPSRTTVDGDGSVWYAIVSSDSNCFHLTISLSNMTHIDVETGSPIAIIFTMARDL